MSLKFLGQNSTFEIIFFVPHEASWAPICFLNKKFVSTSFFHHIFFSNFLWLFCIASGATLHFASSLNVCMSAASVAMSQFFYTKVRILENLKFLFR